MRYRFYTTSETAWRGMLSAIAAAKKSVYLEMYIFQNDTAGYDFFSALEKKAHEGIRVIVVLDAFGSYGLALGAIDRLRRAGAEVLFFSSWFRRLHRKVLILDESTAFLGGVNISNAFAKWRDLQVRVSGKIVHSIVRSFARIYRECGGRNPALKEKDALPVFAKTRMWLLGHGIGGKRYSLRKHYENHIGEATHSIVLVTPYLVPHRWLIARLHQAVLRGVRVEIMVPEHTDHVIIDRVNYYYLGLFVKLGAACLLSKEMNHSKAMLVDERAGTVGSNNLDTLSFNWNEETGVFFKDIGMIRKLRQIIELWEKTALPFSPKTHPHGRLGAFLAFIFRIF
jgi:cardiolipin synthase